MIDELGDARRDEVTVYVTRVSRSANRRRVRETHKELPRTANNPESDKTTTQTAKERSQNDESGNDESDDIKNSNVRWREASEKQPGK